MLCNGFRKLIDPALTERLHSPVEGRIYLINFLIGLAFVAMILIPAIVGYVRTQDGKSKEHSHEQSHDQSREN
jgi:hypothetical protein